MIAGLHNDKTHPIDIFNIPTFTKPPPGSSENDEANKLQSFVAISLFDFFASVRFYKEKLAAQSSVDGKQMINKKSPYWVPFYAMYGASTMSTHAKDYLDVSKRAVIQTGCGYGFDAILRPLLKLSSAQAKTQGPAILSQALVRSPIILPFIYGRENFYNYGNDKSKDAKDIATGGLWFLFFGGVLGNIPDVCIGILSSVKAPPKSLVEVKPFLEQIQRKISKNFLQNYTASVPYRLACVSVTCSIISVAGFFKGKPFLSGSEQPPGYYN